MNRRIKLSCALAALLLTAALLLGTTLPTHRASAAAMKSFSTYEELVAYVQKNTALARQVGGMLFDGAEKGSGTGSVPAATEQAPQGIKGMAENGVVRQPAEAPADFSTTNVQVEGVDEADMVKSDGRHLYAVSGTRVAIVMAQPAREAKVVSTIQCDGWPEEIMINKDTLVIFGRQAPSHPGPQQSGNGDTNGGIVPVYPDRVFVQVYNLQNREKPVRQRNITFQGHYLTSRMIGDYVYSIFNMPLAQDQIELPELNTNGQAHQIQPADIFYFDYPDRSYRYTLVLAINTQSGDSSTRTFLTGTGQSIYASTGHLYLTGPKTPDFTAYTGKVLEEMSTLVPAKIKADIDRIKNSNKDPGQKLQELDLLLDGFLSSLDERVAVALEEQYIDIRNKWKQEMARERDKTLIHKLALNKDNVEYRCSGEVPGQVLNQFSMDEYQGMFRIATTSTGNLIFNERPVTRNNIYILNENLQTVGKLQGLAPAERIYAARFMGSRAYLVTFRNVDPLFVVDLKDPRQPKVLGELKIPGYSGYLHPYDENHLIGIGREIIEQPVPLAQSRPEIAIFQPPVPRDEGIKVAFFDVSDPSNPKETAKYVIQGDADSPALQDHRAVLFSRSKNLLAIPVSFSPRFIIMEQPETKPGKKPVDPGFWTGVYVFTLSPEQDINLKGKVIHGENLSAPPEAPALVKRSLYIDNVLYTVSEQTIKLSDLENLKEIKQIRLQ
ncbi:hypothetical protein GFC01_00615 [Desulfofundulus thermobenzoicus]|uniref:Copper amine oxidase-like N-terminal domain-containing protein n=1 Tax=Desulfofundulus thermobenzoicus TaxID=29376 RepID=A0A6N7ILG9_9FIRM|nr:beta-propeller domain-containing protein [Desulfofundulus thermobenzoicus]MQL50805.1 hypothetical protein [Desulfofundulus thermobenzoicus]